MYENSSKYMEKNGNEKTELKLQKKYTLSNNCNAYGPFFKQPVFLAAAFIKLSQTTHIRSRKVPLAKIMCPRGHKRNLDIAKGTSVESTSDHPPDTF